MAIEKSMGITLTKTMSGSEVADLLIGKIVSLGSLGVESEETDVTTLDSNGWKEVVQGLKDGGDFTFKALLDNRDVFTTLLALAKSGALEEYTLEASSGDNWVVDAFVKLCKESEHDVNSVRAFDITLRISGEPVFNEAVASA